MKRIPPALFLPLVLFPGTLFGQNGIPRSADVEVVLLSRPGILVGVQTEYAGSGMLF